MGHARRTMVCGERRKGPDVTLGNYLKVLRKRALTVLSLLLLGLVAAVAVTGLMPKTYASSATNFVSLSSKGSQPDALYQNSQFALNRVASYTELVHSPLVLQPVIDQLNLDTAVNDLDKDVSAVNPAQTVLVTVTAKADSPQQAQAIASSVAREMGTRIEAIEQPRDAARSPVKVSMAVPATLPTGPVSPRPLLNLGLGILVGLAAGVAAAVMREQFDTSLKSSEDIQKITGQTPLGIIGFDPVYRSHPLVTSHTGGTRLEDFRTIRTNLQFVDVNGPTQVIVVSSAIASEGKSLTACNLAIALAQGGRSVCLVEGDLRRPKAMSYFGVDGTVGLTNVIAGQHSLDEVLIGWNRGTVTLLPAGPQPPDPSQLLGSPATAALIRELRDRFDTVIIDAPPLLPVSDAAVLSGEADGVVMIVRHGHVRKDQVAAAFKGLQAANARLIGTIRTQVPRRIHQAVVGGDYGYGYHVNAPAPLLESQKPAPAHEEPVDDVEPQGEYVEGTRWQDRAGRS